MINVLNNRLLGSFDLSDILCDKKPNAKSTKSNEKKIINLDRKSILKTYSVITEETNAILKSRIFNYSEYQSEMYDMIEFVKLITNDTDLIIELTNVNMCIYCYLSYLIHYKNKSEDTVNEEMIILDRIKYLRSFYLLLISEMFNRGARHGIIYLDDEGERIKDIKNFSVFGEGDAAIKVNNNQICDTIDSIAYDLDLNEALTQMNGKSMINMTNDSYTL